MPKTPSAAAVQSAARLVVVPAEQVVRGEQVVPERSVLLFSFQFEQQGQQGYRGQTGHHQF